MEKILFRLIIVITVIIAIYCVVKFVLFSGKDLSPIALVITFLIGSILGDVVYDLIKKKIYPK